MNKIEIDKLLPDFIKKWTHGEEFTTYWQRFEKSFTFPGATKEDEKPGLTYVHTRKKPTRQDWFDHFSQKPRNTYTHIYGSMAMVGLFTGRVVKWICFDADNEEEYDTIINKVIPWLKDREVQYLLEYSQAGRCHLWVFVEAIDYSVAERLAIQIRNDCNAKDFGEVYPFGSRKTNAIRVINGWHYWTQSASDVERWDGEFSSDPAFVMRAVIDCKPVTADEIDAWCAPAVVEKQVKRKRQKTVFRYLPIDLPPLVETKAEIVNTITCQCLAYRRLLWGIKNDERIEKAGITYHDTGMKMSALCLFNDIVLGSATHREGRDLWDDLQEIHRGRDAKSHMWNGDNNIRKYEDNPIPLISSCKTMSDQFGMCRGCPYRGMPDFENPRQLLDQPGFLGRPVRKVKIKDVNVTTLDQIRNIDFPKISDYVTDILADDARFEAILLAHPQGAGKSVFADLELVRRAVAMGKSVLIAVPTAKLAMEHRDRLASIKINAELCLSHEKTFCDDNPYDLGFACPHYSDIQYYTQLSLSSSFCKKKFCEKKCLFKDNCPYPTQYARAADPNHKVVIIQHAHFRAEAAMRQIMSRQFDLMIIDENFTDGMVTSVKPLEAEWTILQNHGAEWADTLGTWMRDGGYGVNKLYPATQDLEDIRQEFQSKSLDYSRLRVFIEAYNGQEHMSPLAGLKKFIPIPEARVLVMTDATPPIDKLKILLNRPNITVFGDNLVFDVRDYHPENKIIAVLDSSVSKTRLLKEERFYDILNYVGVRCSTLYKEDRILITTYRSAIGKIGDERRIENPIKETISYLKSSFPGLDVGDEYSDCRIIVSGMTVGTNAYEDFNVQFMLASVHLSANDHIIEEYHLKVAMNYYRRLNGQHEMLNPYPSAAFEGKPCEIEIDFAPITKVETTGVYAYDSFNIPIPKNAYHKLSYYQAVGSSQQTDRIRYFPGMPVRRIVENLSNLPMPGLANTEIKLFDQCLAES
jgi:hypothetical protein